MNYSLRKLRQVGEIHMDTYPQMTKNEIRAMYLNEFGLEARYCGKLRTFFLYGK